MDEKCHVILFNKEVILEETEQSQVITLHVTGMGCVNCANRVHNSLIDHPGVLKAEVNHVTGKAEVTYLPTKASVPQLIAMVAGAGDHRHTYRAAYFGAGEVHDEYCNDFDGVANVTPIAKARTLVS